MKEGRIFLIRHGRTAWNGRRYLGSKDIPLDQTGLGQAQEVLRLLEGERIDAIYSSPLSRAVETIRPLAEAKRLSIQTADELKEMSYGEWEGAFKSEQKLPIRNHLFLSFSGGESLFDLYRRAMRFLSHLKSELEGERSVVIVGHFQVNQMLMGILNRDSFETILDRVDYRPGNGTVFEIRYTLDADDRIAVVSSRWMNTPSERNPRPS